MDPLEDSRGGETVAIQIGRSRYVRPSRKGWLDSDVNLVRPERFLIAEGKETSLCLF